MADKKLTNLSDISNTFSGSGIDTKTAYEARETITAETSQVVPATSEQPSTEQKELVKNSSTTEQANNKRLNADEEAKEFAIYALYAKLGVLPEAIRELMKIPKTRAGNYEKRALKQRLWTTPATQIIFKAQEWSDELCESIELNESSWIILNKEVDSWKLKFVTVQDVQALCLSSSSE